MISVILSAWSSGKFSNIVARRGGWFYLLFLTIPFFAVLVQSLKEGSLEGVGIRAPVVFGLPEGAALVVGWIAALIVGTLLFYHELTVSIFIRRQLSRNALKRWQTLVDGASPSLPRHVVGFAEYMGLSFLICLAEEFLWRGFLISFLKSEFGFTSPTAILLASLLFGLNHVYHGFRNISLKVVDGIVWGIVFVATSSLWIPFWSHLLFQYLVWLRLRRQAAVINTRGE